MTEARGYLTRIFLLCAVLACTSAIAAPPLKLRTVDVDLAADAITDWRTREMPAASRERALQPIREEVRALVKKIAERDGLQIVEATDVVFARKGYDITEDVVREYKAAKKP